tara:strand:- start:1834 stop:2484 length:651 start_codon:yes stop_codon:yes gene_type:complete
MNSNWEAGKQQSNYHFNWNSKPLAGYDYRWLARFKGDWSRELADVVKQAKHKTWATRGKKYHPDHAQLESELEDLRRAGMDEDTVIFRKHFEFQGVFKSMLDSLGLENTKQAFHIQYPGEMLNLHIDKQHEMNKDTSQVARFFIFLEDWKPGHFFQMGTSFLKWQKGDLVWFDWPNIPHASANAGWEPRCLIQVTGTITDVTKQLLLNQIKHIRIV